MNYLAHLHLGGQEPEQLLGSLYGDFVKGALAGRFSARTEEAINLHRKIDVFTDSHPVVRRALGRFTVTRRRYAGIALDMFFDHCLARDWDRYAETTLDAFSKRVYTVLRSEADLPERLARIAPLIISEDWLGAYRDFSMIGHGLDVISERLSGPENLHDAFEELTNLYLPLSSDFEELYPSLMRFAKCGPAI
ncbi:ACP phosphodiesterase [Pseudomonas sp. S04]|uniref:acyl carrier protein phosphodiesterase n=1 Tax=unclassified Pseudomonas TaxID=196821 RepID=UPI0013202FC2|nr:MULTISPECIES: ACP phosphodiesterase [unclassified Pseudomonas]QHD01993.1 ACP phosphodiesterase [Pseudomonas sp. S04]QHF34476.1 ACP phosphodiesterase [Pseudomonas sp. S19]